MSGVQPILGQHQSAAQPQELFYRKRGYDLQGGRNNPLLNTAYQMGYP